MKSFKPLYPKKNKPTPVEKHKALNSFVKLNPRLCTVRVKPTENPRRFVGCIIYKNQVIALSDEKLRRKEALTAGNTLLQGMIVQYDKSITAAVEGTSNAQ